MDDGTKYLKNVFRIENILGTSSVTLDNPNQSPYKKVFSCILIVLIVSYNLHVLASYFASNDSHVPPWYVTLNRRLHNGFLVYALAVGLIDSEGKRTAAVNLAAIETHLQELNIDVPNNSLETAAAYFSGCSFVCSGLMTLWALIFTHFTIFDSALLLYTLSVRSSQTFGYLVLLLKCLRIKMALCKDIDISHPQILLEEASQVESGPYIIQRRIAWAEESEYERRNLNLVEKVHAALNSCLQEIKSRYIILVISLSVVSAIFGPVHFIKNMAWNQLPYTIVHTLYFLFHLATNVSFVLIEAQLQKVDKSYEDKLRALRVTSAGEESRREVRHLLLRHVHSSEPYNCYLFDVDFTLLSTIIETTLFLVTTYLSDG